MATVLTVCGSRGSFPTAGERFREYGTETSCYCLRDGDGGLIIDCGSGLYRALELLKDCSSVDVVLSHVHYDHIMGLFENRAFFEERDVTFYGNFDAWRAEESGDSLFSVDALIPGKKRQAEFGIAYELSSGFTVRFSPSNHGDGTAMIEITKEAMHLRFTGDYEHSGESEAERWTGDCDLLLFDGSYAPEDYPKFKGWGHSSWETGCRIAEGSGAKKLLITHHAPQYDDAALEEQERRAKVIFPEVEFARQDSVYIL